MILSILIPTLTGRRELFNGLCANIYSQIQELDAYQDVEVIFDDSTQEEKSTGFKRNVLLTRARGKYFWMIDDDDEISVNAIRLLLEAAKTDCDVMAINGIITTDGKDEKQWFIALGNPYRADHSTGKEVYLRYPNHITPMKRELVNKIKFPHISQHEDKAWADLVKEADVLKTQTIISQPMYHYKFSTKNKSYV